MGFLAQAVAEAKGDGVYERWLQMLDIGSRSKAGPSVNLQTAFRVSAAFACMREISQGCAQVPFKLLQATEEAGLARRRPAKKHPVYDLVTAKPNRWQTAFEFIETLALHASLGNAYVYKNMYRGQPGELLLLNPSRVTATQLEDWSAVYKVRGKDGTSKDLDSSLIWHVRGPSWDGFLGLDTLDIAKEALGLSMALEQSHASLHANGVRPTGVYSVEGTLDDKKHEQLTTWLKKNAAGAMNAGAPLVLDRAAKWLTTTMSGVDAQHKETRDHEIEEVCRFFGVLPSIIGFTGDKANTYASAEVMETAHKVRTLGRWYKRLQDSANVNLLTDDERAEGYYFKFISNALMAVNAKDRSEYFSRALGSGGAPAYMTQDEVRELDDLDPFGGEAAKLPPRVAAPVADPKVAEAAKAIGELEQKLERLQERQQPAPSLTVNLNQEPVSVNMAAAPVTVNQAEQKQQAPAVVNVQNDIHVPPGPAPVVNNEVNVPPTSVTLEATLPSMTVVAQIPARKTHSETTVTRDNDGNITGSTTDGTERDA